MSLPPMPSSDQFRPLVLRYLADGKARGRPEIYEAVADLAHMSADARAERLPSGGLRYRNRIGWACSGLYHAGLISRPQRGVYQITDDGRAVDARKLQTYSERELSEWPKWRAYQAEIQTRHQLPERVESPASADAERNDSSPLETLTASVAAVNSETETELRRRLQEASPEFFEKAVIELLWAMGYGGSHGEKQHVGKSHDGGIDGVIRQDALGLQNVYVQAKRYADGNSVGRQAIQQFYGALASRGAERGVFITTSTFTEHAQSEARSYRGKIVLIDGIRLTALMLAYGVGVQPFKAFTLYEVDDDFFEADIN